MTHPCLLRRGEAGLIDEGLGLGRVPSARPGPVSTGDPEAGFPHSQKDLLKVGVRRGKSHTGRVGRGERATCFVSGTYGYGGCA